MKRYILYIIGAILALYLVGGVVIGAVGTVAGLIVGMAGYVVVALVAGKVGMSLGAAKERKQLTRGL